MQICLPYGRSFITADLPDGLKADWLEPPAVAAAANPLELVEAALNNPLGGIRLEDYAGVKSVAVAINDKTRPVPHQYLLPPLLKKLEGLGIPAKAVTLVIAVGLHAPMTPDEFGAVVPEEILKRYRVVSHDARNPDGLVHLGQIACGTPVWVNKTFYQAELRIVVGNIEPHQFVGFSGGMKTAAIGLGGADTIQNNHAMLTQPGARIGEYETNPPRQDVEEIGTKMGVHFALNAVLNQDKKIVHVLAGQPRAVMLAGIPLSRQVCQLGVDAAYDLLIVSPGGHPKDLNVYQMQKGLAHAALVVRPGGSMILTAACPEGVGSQSYAAWMQGMTSYEQVLERFKREPFRVGPHKAYLIARDAQKIKLMLVSDMPADLAQALLLNPVENLQQAIDLALPGVPTGGRIGIMPHAASTIPFIKS